MSFFVILSSNENSLEFINTLSNFTNIIHHESVLNDDWYVSFRSISIKTPRDADKINIHLEEVEREHNNGNSATLIESIPLTEDDKKLPYFTFETERGVYFPISKNNIRELNVQITDEGNENINIEGYGQPTLLKVKFKEMPEMQHIVNLSSKHSTHIFTNNVPWKFSNRLNFPLKLEGEGWHVALTNILFPDTKNVLAPFPFHSYTKQGVMTYIIATVIHATNEVNDDGEQFQRLYLNHMEEVIKDEELLKQTLLKFLRKLLPRTVFNEETNRFECVHEKKFSIFFSDGMEELFVEPLVKGVDVYELRSEFDQNQRLFKKSFIWSYNIDQYRVRNMLCYCDIISHIYWGEQKMKVLKVIPLFHKNNSNYVKYQPKHLDFIPVESNEISKIEIQLATSSGQLIQFKKPTDYVELNLQFVKKG